MTIVRNDRNETFAGDVECLGQLVLACTDDQPIRFETGAVLTSSLPTIAASHTALVAVQMPNGSTLYLKLFAVA